MWMAIVHRPVPMGRMVKMTCHLLRLLLTSWRISHPSRNANTSHEKGKKKGENLACATIHPRYDKNAQIGIDLQSSYLFFAICRPLNSSWNSTLRIFSSRINSEWNVACNWKLRWKRLVCPRRLNVRWGGCYHKRNPITSVWSEPRWTKPCFWKSKVML